MSVLSPTPKVTPEVNPEVTPEVTPEVNLEVTPEVNLEVTPDNDEIEYVFIEEPDDTFNPFEMPFNDYLPRGILVNPESDAYANEGCASSTCN